MIERLESAAQVRSPIPARAGIGLRAPHHAVLIADRPEVGWLEVHSENYFADGGAQLEHLARARALYPISVHGVGLSLGSADALDGEHLRKLKRLVHWLQPGLVSEHLSWSSVDGVFLNDLLPLPYTQEVLAHLDRRITQVQEYLGREIAIENISSYLRYPIPQLDEAEFLGELAQRAGCGLLIDINNIHVSARNHGFDAARYLCAISPRHVRELHLAGHTATQHDGREILIDTHSAPVSTAVWSLYELALARFGPVPTLIEWDAELPALQVLVREAARAESLLEGAHARAA